MMGVQGDGCSGCGAIGPAGGGGRPFGFTGPRGNLLRHFPSGVETHRAVWGARQALNRVRELDGPQSRHPRRCRRLTNLDFHFTVHFSPRPTRGFSSHGQKEKLALASSSSAALLSASSSFLFHFSDLAQHEIHTGRELRKTAGKGSFPEICFLFVLISPPFFICS